MSNDTPQTPAVVEGVVVTDATPTTPMVPKAPGKLVTALKHPVQTMKRHKSAVLVSFGVACGSVATFMLCKKDPEVEASDESNDSSDDSDSNEDIDVSI